MKHTSRGAVLLALAALPLCLHAQRGPGRPIGTVTPIGNLIHLQLDPGAITPERLFDLDHRTLRFTPDPAGGYRVAAGPLHWESETGATLSTATAVLTGFRFPFSGRNWDTLTVAIGAITFGTVAPTPGTGRGQPVGNNTGAGTNTRAGFPMVRYPTLQTVGRSFINATAGIAAFVKPALTGSRAFKELNDRAIVTWNLSEGAGGIQAFTWTPTVNRIQAVLYKSGVIELSYNDVSARDAVVGVFPRVDAGVARTLATLDDPADAAVAPHLDMKRVTLDVVDNLYLRVTIETRGPIPHEDDPAVEGIGYRVALRRADAPASTGTTLWRMQGIVPPRGSAAARGGVVSRWGVAGEGLEPQATVSGNTISIRGVLPAELAGAREIAVVAEASAGTAPAVDSVTSRPVRLAGITSPEVDLSTATNDGGPYAVAYEGFHWPEIPRAVDVACSIITKLGDHFDFIASYSDFRVDNPEGGTPSTGPRGGNVSGIGSNTNGLENYCSQGRLQWMYVEPVSTAAVQSNERSPDGRMTDYDYAMSQIGHELGHRWAADARALVNGETILLGPVHWAPGVHLPAAFPYGRPGIEADAMGGSTWKDNGDGTYTQLDRDYYSPAKGFSWLGLYLMGLAKPEEVQPFFILRNLQRTGQSDAAGHPIFRGDKTVVTIQDVIASMGPRVPDFDHAQKQFNTAIVVMTMPGQQPTKELITAANNIADHWIAYWAKVTGGRSVMTVSPK